MAKCYSIGEDCYSKAKKEWRKKEGSEQECLDRLKTELKRVQAKIEKLRKTEERLQNKIDLLTRQYL